MRLQRADLHELARTIDWSLDAAGCPHPDAYIRRHAVHRLHGERDGGRGALWHIGTASPSPSHAPPTGAPTGAPVAERVAGAGGTQEWLATGRGPRRAGSARSA